MSRFASSIALAILLLVSATVLACAGGEGATGEADAEAEHLDAMSAEHAGEEPTATAATEGAVATGREVAYATVDGVAIEGYLAAPDESTAGQPALIVIHEWWGLNDNVRRMADKLAAEGYTALAVDLYAGAAADSPERARELMQQAMADRDAVRDNLRQAYAYLDGEAGATAIGSIGWCFGGGWSLQTALLFPQDLDAAVIYYGHVGDVPREELATLDVPILAHFGGADSGIPVETARAFESALQELDKEATVHVYEGAQHAFANPSGERYDAAAAETAWQRTVDFLAEHLRGDGDAVM